MFKQITIVGTGLIGGSFALALKKHAARPRPKIVGCDRADVLARAHAMRAIDTGTGDCGRALAGSQLIVLATPVGQVLDFLERFGPLLPPEVFVTDVGSTKEQIVARARDVFGAECGSRFLGGHPMAGKEHGGIEHADANLFRDAPWLLTPGIGQDIRAGRSGELAQLLEQIGARVLAMDAARHDQICAWISHLPQMVATALAASVADFEAQFRAGSGDDPEVLALGGRALREMTRIASSPYSMWRDIALTNTANIEDALLALEQRLAHIREGLKTRTLEEEFARARGLRPPPPGKKD